MGPVLTSSTGAQNITMRPLFGCIAALQDHCAASFTVDASSRAVCTAWLPKELQQCLPGALLEYAVALAGCSAQGDQSVGPTRNERGQQGADEGTSKPVLGLSREQLLEYPDGIVYDLLASQPELLEAFQKSLVAFASSSSKAPSARGVSRGHLQSYSSETRVLLGLQIRQRMVQHERLRAALLLGTMNPLSMVSALSEAAAAAATLSGSAVAGARQKLLSLQEIHFGTA